MGEGQNEEFQNKEQTKHWKAKTRNDKNMEYLKKNFEIGIFLKSKYFLKSEFFRIFLKFWF